ncbi:uncharacterized protein LOC125680900 [Ostrea edulis]|uniref:uncharacterized protein LOC125680900 n=1 Tax=Ostrea edulis TaxID=37623 RepID=UPI0024AFFEE1|nr:uncharacterized protein LOC125680900 [Ostrea edulis]
MIINALCTQSRSNETLENIYFCDHTSVYSHHRSMSWRRCAVWYPFFLLLILRINVFGVRFSVREVTDKVCTPVMPELALEGPCNRKQCNSNSDCRRGKICCLTKTQRCRRCMNPDINGMVSREAGVQFQIRS